MASSQSTVLPATTTTRSPGLTLRSRSASRPHGGALGDLAEGAVLDDPFAREERQRAALRIARERLDDVAREVEAVRDLPAAVDERRAQRKLERRAGQLVSTPAASADAKTFHGLAIIDPKRPEAECESCDCAESVARFGSRRGREGRSSLRGRARRRTPCAGSPSGRRNPPASSSAAIRVRIGGCVLNQLGERDDAAALGADAIGRALDPQMRRRRVCVAHRRSCRARACAARAPSPPGR